MSRSFWTQFATFKRIFYNEQVYNNFSTFDQNSYNFSSISPAKNDVLCNIWNVKEIVDGFNTSTSTNYSNELPKICGQSDMILPLLLQHMTNKVVAAIGIGTISAAVMSSADSSILSCSSMLARNVYKIAIRPKASEKEVLIVLKICIVVCGGFATFMACSGSTIMYLFILCSDLVYTVLFPQLVLTVHFSRFCNGYGAYSGFLTAFLLRVLSGGLLSADHVGVIDWGDGVPFRTVLMLLNLALTLAVSQLSVMFFRWMEKSRGDLYDEFKEKWDFLGVECLEIEDEKRVICDLEGDDGKMCDLQYMDNLGNLGMPKRMKLTKIVVDFEKRRKLLNLAPIRPETAVSLRSVTMKKWSGSGEVNKAAELS